MKRGIFSFILISLVIYLQTNFLNQLAFRSVKPDIALILLIFISIRGGTVQGTTLGFFSGLLEDFLSLAPLGFHSFIKTVIGFLSSILGSFISVESRVFHLITVLVMTLFKYVLAALLVGIFSIDKSAISMLDSSLLIEAVYNAILAPLLFTLFNWICNKWSRG